MRRRWAVGSQLGLRGPQQQPSTAIVFGGSPSTEKSGFVERFKDFEISRCRLLLAAYSYGMPSPVAEI